MTPVPPRAAWSGSERDSPMRTRLSSDIPICPCTSRGMASRSSIPAAPRSAAGRHIARWAMRPSRADGSSFTTWRCHDLWVADRAIAVLTALGIAALSGCGSSDDEDATIAGGADPETVQVIKGWADELRAGNVGAASKRFALPSVVQNGTPPLRLNTRGEVEAFNRSLPCGAKL